MNKDLFQVRALVPKNGIKTMADGTIRITVDCQEVCAEEMTLIFKLIGSIGWFMFKEVAFEEKDLEIPDFKPEFKTEKTPSKRLRDIMFVLWEKNGAKGEFDDYYKKQMNYLCDTYKEKLD